MLLKEEDFIHNEYYAVNNRLFRIIGLSQNEKSVKEYMHTCIINIIITTAILIQIYVLFTSERKIDIIAKSLETTLPALCFGTCYYNLLLNGAIMKKIMHRIKCDWDNIADKSELTILEKYAAASRLYTIIITISFYVYVAFLIYPSQWSMIQFNFGKINKTELTLPIDFKLFIKNQFLYYFGNFYLCIYINIICLVGVSNYTMFIAVIQHACGLLDILVWRINERFKHKLYYGHRSCSSVEENEWIIGIIKFYNNAMDFVNLLKLFYETIYVFEGFYALIFIMVDYVYIFQLLSFTSNTRGGLIRFFYVIGSLFVIYIYFFIGQKLINHHVNLFINVCQIPFYSLSLSAQRIYLFLIINSMRPCNLSFKGAIIVSHNLFSKIMRMAFSFTKVFYNVG